MHAGGGVDALDTQALARLGALGAGTSCRAARRLCHAASLYGQKRPEVPQLFPWHGVVSVCRERRCAAPAAGLVAAGRPDAERPAGRGPPVSRRRWRARGPRAVSAGLPHFFGGEAARVAQFRDGGLEVLERVERPVDGREAQVGDEVEFLQRAEYGQTHVVGGQLGAAGGAHRLLDPLAELGERVLGDRPSLACLADAGDDLGTTEGLGHAAALDHHQRGTSPPS